LQYEYEYEYELKLEDLTVKEEEDWQAERLEKYWTFDGLA